MPGKLEWKWGDFPAQGAAVRRVVEVVVFVCVVAAVCCSVLQWVAVRRVVEVVVFVCVVVAVCCSVLQCVAVCCSVL